MLHIRKQIKSRIPGTLGEKLIGHFTCEGCGKEVERKELVIPVGPRKGEVIVSDFGCKCENIRLAKRAVLQANRCKMRRMERMFDNGSMMNESLRRATFESYKAPTRDLQQVKERLMVYADQFDTQHAHNILLQGNYGVGKSHLAAAIAKTVMANGCSALFLSVPKLLTKIKNTYGRKERYSEAEILDMVGEVNLFILDDLGTEYTNDWQDGRSWTHTKLFEVLDARAGKPTIFTTNLSGSELEEKMNERNMSRLLDRTEIIRMKGPDYRRSGFSVAGELR